MKDTNKQVLLRSFHLPLMHMYDHGCQCLSTWKATPRFPTAGVSIASLYCISCHSKLLRPMAAKQTKEMPRTPEKTFETLLFLGYTAFYSLLRATFVS